MKSVSRTLILGSLLSTTLLATGAWASPLDPTAPLTVTIKYDDLDLNTDQGATKLYARLRIAARAVCARDNGRDLSRRALYRACYKQALSAAVADVNRDRLTAMHERNKEGSAS